MAAKDEAEWQRNRARLYAPPPEERRAAAAGRASAGRVGMTRAQAAALLGQIAAEDAKVGGGGGG
ncbi:hypothetical protein [Planotetraspora sp. GP83]|uniref:hypothetical protein n=1 Tax=Planotetraspora sp. GP83 TaxID=3156264 RepID=UPI003518F14C